MSKDKKTKLKVKTDAGTVEVSLQWVHTLIIGSGAAGLNAAVQLSNQGVEDILILTEGLKMGTSINTGSDKQTYYKVSLCGEDADAPGIMAQTYFAGGSMHGDLALAEAAGSARAFLNLVNMGVPFPQDPYGQYIGYKTDHDPRQRATSIGPYTSKQMCLSLIREVERRGIRVKEKRDVVSLLTVEQDGEKRACGALVMDRDGELQAFGSENVVFAVGGPGGIYRTSVYPVVHTGAIGLALMAGAKAQSLPESQYGMASIKFRWNVSGTYMQVVPRFISTDKNGNDEREFLDEYFTSSGERDSMIFLKGYQWPFDPRKAIGGSSIVDILVYVETVVRGRRVFLDYRSEPTQFSFDGLSEEAHTYLKKSEALIGLPIARLQKMNPGAIELYRDHGIDIHTEPLEIAVCAQHNNGGLAGSHWWESANIKHLFPVGEVNGTHGVYRPGGSALNSGQVGSMRAADFIAKRYREWTVDRAAVADVASTAIAETSAFLATCRKSARSWEDERAEFQARMSRAGAHIRAAETIEQALGEAREQWRRLSKKGCNPGKRSDPKGLREALRNRHLCYSHLVYLDALKHQVESGVGSRGSALVLDPGGEAIHPKLGSEWKIAGENESFREKVLETVIDGDTFNHAWVSRRPLPTSDLWFETAWAKYREGKIYD